MLKELIIGLFAILISCGQSHHLNKMETKPVYQEDFIQGNDVKLHYLDWGGSGKPLILIHGLGDSPYLFEDLASSLKSKFRIIAYSRRGHAKSTTRTHDYDNATLVADLKLLLDSLDIEKASLLGWSMGGNEITEFAIRYPEITDKLIYFESGYDLSQEAFKNILKALPKSLFPVHSDQRSLDAYRKWYHKFWFADVDWNPTLEANLRATTQINPDGGIATIPNDSISAVLLESAMSYRRDYTKIHSPSLVIYTKQFFVPPVGDETIVSLYEHIETSIITPWRLNNMNQMKTELKNVRIEEMPLGSHTSFIFLSKNLLIETITTFLEND